MNKSPSKMVRRTAVSIGFLLIAVSVAFASAPVQSNYVQEKDGLIIYFGIVPAGMLSGFGAQKMHGGIPEEGTHRMHLAVAVFDKKTRRRVTEATVKARMVAVGQNTGLKPLEPMRWKDKLVYGNYFSLFVAGPYTIEVQIGTSKSETPVEVTFQYNVAHV